MPEDDLEPLITECPGCRTRFRVSEDQLQRARGRVRCGACLTVFNGVEHLDGVPPQALDQGAVGQALDALLDELTAPAPPHAGAATTAAAPAAAAKAARPATAPRPAAVPPGATPGVETVAPPDPAAAAGAAPEDAESAAADAATDSATTDAATDVAADSAADAVAPVTPDPAAPAAPVQAVAAAPAVAPAAGAARRPDPHAGTVPAPVAFGEPRRRRPWLWLAVPLGVVLLAAQVLWLRFDDWSTDPFWRGVYGPACDLLGCQLPVQRDIGRLATRQLAVRSHPQQPGSLLVSALIVNEAEFAQPFPMLELRFTTPRGLLVAGRRFAPAEYLSGDARGMTQFPPRTPVQIELTIDDPGPDAVNYFLRFR